jgi:O-methyltransferase
MKFNIDQFNAETEDQSEWNLSGWAFVPGQALSGARIELRGKKIGVALYGSERADVMASHPDLCPGANIGFTAHFFLPAGMKQGQHHLHIVLLDRENEAGRIPLRLELQHEIKATVHDLANPQINADHANGAYLDLLEKTLLGLPYAEAEERDLREDGRDWPKLAHSMIGRQRLRHLRACGETVLRDGVPGDFMETGVWRGGACILLRGILHAFDIHDRDVWLADSFKGLPPPDAANYPADAGDRLYTFKELAVSLEHVRKNFRSYGLLDGHVKFLEGYFSETLPGAPVQQLALLRLDGDMYESTMDALRWLYPKLSPGGFCIIDDYGGIPACRQAVRDYRAAIGITEPMSMIDWTGVYWRKARASADKAAISQKATRDHLADSPPASPPAVDFNGALPSSFSLGGILPLGNLVFMEPARLAPSAWLEHIPFAFWLVDQMRPATVVELGVHHGVSYCAFCQAVAALRLDARCTGVDTFSGDAQAGHYGPEVLHGLRAIHDPLYGHFSDLVQSSFADALSRFGENSIDLLHIDGSHTYEDVKHDFQTWRPKLSRHAVVLFHDIRVTTGDFGVHQLWNELSHEFQSFEFYHGFGLGVLAVGDQPARAIKALVELPEPACSAVRRIFSALGNRIGLLSTRESRPGNAQEHDPLNSEIVSLRSKLAALAEQQTRLQHAFMNIADAAAPSAKDCERNPEELFGQ